MKNKTFIAGAVVCVAIATYLVKRMKTSRRRPVAISADKRHHLTDVFARAKHHSNNIASDLT